MPKEDAILGCLLGTAVGDAIGLPCEGLSRKRLERMFPDLDGHRFLFGRGMTSDDTEHTAMLAQALIVSAGDAERFARDFAWRLRGWLLGLPAAVGLATLRALAKLWVGFPPARSGVFSAGNGPAMRSALLGVCYGDDPEKLRALVRANTRITHTDPKAEHGAMAVAVAAYFASQGKDVSEEGYVGALAKMLGQDAGEMIGLAERALHATGLTTEGFARDLGLHKGVSGYVFHTVPVALHAWNLHPTDFRAAVLKAIRCGGDTDTVAAIVGALVGARVGKDGIPRDWLVGVRDWPRSTRWLEALGRRLAQVVSGGEPQPAVPLAVWGILPRNLFFLLVILLHGLRRLLPPY